MCVSVPLNPVLILAIVFMFSLLITHTQCNVVFGQAEFACEMSCDACKSKIESVLRPLSGVRIVNVDVDGQRLLLELDTKSAHSVTELQTLIESGTGIRTVVKGLGTEVAAVSEIHGAGNELVGVVRLAQLLGNKCK